LSVSNCDEIFGLVNLRKLAMEQYPYGSPELYSEDQAVIRVAAFEQGFNKALELQKDKLFTKRDMIDAYQQGENARYSRNGEAVLEAEFIHSLQQPNEIEVEIEMEQIIYPANMPKEGEERPAMRPKLDAEDCLILKKI
jgi:hypothetical protein